MGIGDLTNSDRLACGVSIGQDEHGDTSVFRFGRDFHGTNVSRVLVEDQGHAAEFYEARAGMI